MDIKSVFELEHLTRRHFFGLNAAGLGTAALASLLGNDLIADASLNRSGNSRGSSRSASLRSKSQTDHLAISVRRPISDGPV